MNLASIPHYTSLANALVSLFGTSVKITRTDRLSGGDINKAYALTLTTGDRIFMKANAKENAAFFTAEAACLSAIAETGAIGTPHLLCTGTDDGEEVGYSFLLMNFIESGKKRADYFETFARELATMHKADTKSFLPLESAENAGTKQFGFFQNNFIGARPQDNTPTADWISFFRDRRLLPQFKAADRYFSDSDRRQNTKLLDHLDNFLTEPEKPSLLHGDLWDGNVLANNEGKAILIDSAAYVGHAEADLAMTELFGGFPPSFYAAYKEAHKMQAGYEDRRDLYNLYHLLNHLNMFGASYLTPVQSIVAEYVG
ncbi:fructosamine kinase family protein [Treponema sp. UBA3813]|uniref:fructosamine kinase family protein n=1 Tax=Treponema sp. UBA3813 TaxID=1947715 RepID=UPI0025F5423C|nr:fructosamine kinase family protein [Treponema sp. UBA3813]